MYITAIEPFTKGKKKIFSEKGYLFWLYDSEIREYGIEEDTILSDSIIDTIENDIVLKRAKQKVLRMLERMDRTKYELLRKLKDAGYTEAISSQAIEYAYNYNYIDDERFAVNYVRDNCTVRSKKAIANALAMKGIDKELVEKAYSFVRYDVCDNPEEAAINKDIAKKLNGREISEYDEKFRQKLAASLFRKGYSYELIKKKINFSEY